MLKAMRFGFLILLLTLTATSVAAQRAARGWQVLLYDGAQVLVVSESGVNEPINLPTEARNLEPVADRYVAISPDRQYFAFASSTMTNDGFTTTLNIANLETRECCITSDSPFTLEGTYVQVGPFSPDSDRLFVAATRWLPESQTYESAFLVIDPTTGAVLQQTESDALWNTGSNTTLLPEWTPEGITLYPTCIPCEGTAEGTAWLWNPDTDENRALDTYYASTGERLVGTGEYIYAAENNDFAPSSGNFPVNNNVIAYRADGTTNSAEQVIYHQPGQFVPRPVWGMDGAAYLLQAPMMDSAVIVDRRGMAESIELPVGILPLAGTPDGWLLWSQTDGSLYHYGRGMDGLWHAEIIGSTAQASRPPQVLERPALGAAVAATVLQSALR